MSKKNRLLCLKRKDIIICPYFRMNFWEYKKNKFAVDMHCSLSDMIFTSRRISGRMRNSDLISLRNEMRMTCYADCPKIWADNEIDDYDSEDEFYNRYLKDQCIPEYDENFKFGFPF